MTEIVATMVGKPVASIVPVPGHVGRKFLNDYNHRFDSGAGKSDCKVHRVETRIAVQTPQIPQGVKRIRKPDGEIWWYWAAHQFTRKPNAFKPRTQLLWRGIGEPSAQELADI